MVRFRFRYAWLLLGLAIIPPVAAVYLTPLPPATPAEVEKAMRKDWNLNESEELRVLQIRPVQRGDVVAEAVIDIVPANLFSGERRYLGMAFCVRQNSRSDPGRIAMAFDLQRSSDRDTIWIPALNDCFSEPKDRQVTADPSEYELERFRNGVQASPTYWLYGASADQPTTFHFGFSGK